MAANSNDLMSNSNSYYSRFYEFDSRYRKKQNLTSSKEAAETIANIILKKKA